MKGLPYEVKSLVAKARDSALLAVETYNRPTAIFRSGAYAVLMHIAWTSLFHAIFLRKGVKPYHRKKGSRRFEKVDGDYKRWELTECLQQHFDDENPPLRKNLEFFARIRNKIEHCALAELDPEIFGECQATLLNFEETICREFGERQAINGGLSFSLQFARRPSPAGPLGKQRDKEFKSLKRVIDNFRTSLSTDVQSSLEYSFKVYLVPKITNHPSGDTLAVEFVKYDPTKPEEMARYEKVVAMIKPQQIPVANAGLLKPGEVVARVSRRLSRKFTQYDHQCCYRHFNTRPAGAAQDPTQCDKRYCHYDAVHKDYCYQTAWVDFLVETLADPAKYELIIQSKKKAGPAATKGASA